MAPGKLRCMMIVCVTLLLIQGASVHAYDTPYINPLGDLDAYNFVDYVAISDQYDPWNFGYWREDDEYYPLDVWGNSWSFEVPGSSLQGLQTYLDSLDGTILIHTDEVIVAQVDGCGGTWWVHARYWGDDYYELTVVEDQESPYETDDQEQEDGAFEDEYCDDEDYGDEDYDDEDYDEDYDDEDYDDEYRDDEYYEAREAEFVLPLINPLGHRDAYESSSYGPAGAIEIGHYNALGERVRYLGWGEEWLLYVPVDDIDHPLLALEEYIIDLGGTVVESSKGMLAASVIDAEGYQWYAIAQVINEELRYSLDITKELLLMPHQTITITPELGQETIGFITNSDGRSHTSLVVEISDGAVNLDGSINVTYGEYTRSLYDGFHIQSEKTPIHVLDSIAQEPGKTIWTLKFEQETMPRQITITLKESVPLPPVTMGGQLGILKITGANIGELSISPSHNFDVYHPDFAEGVGDLSPEGDYVFYLPAGYWDVQQWSLGYPTVRARMVPVSSGQITVFTMPSVTQTVFDELTEYAEVDHALELSRHLVQGGQGEFDVILTPAVSHELIPTITNTEISEGGIMGEVISIEPVMTPPDIVLLLDSSGSMRAQMEQTLTTAREFIGSLGDDAFIQIIDFDTKPKVLAGTSKTEVLASLASVRADGATCLYDSILAGLGLLEKKDRPVLVVFTDGVDANYDDSGPGSVATLPEVIRAVQESQIPLYTIGFGSGHDKTVLQQLADISHGKYYPAVDQNALNQVFRNINESLSKAYHVVYQRPTEPSISDVPVVSIMVDTSGSMDMPPEEEDCGYRMQKVKNILHDFVLGLPEHTLMQIQSFSWDTSIEQSMTLDKASVLHAIGTFSAGGATDILGSIQVAYQTLSTTPSKNKTLVYITDAAIAMDEDQESLFHLLKGIAESDVKVIWMGIGMEEAEAIFADVAERSLGRYVVTEDPVQLASALDEILAEVKMDAADSSAVEIRLAVKESGVENVVTRYTGVLNVPYTILAQNQQVVGPEIATYFGTGSAADVRELHAYGLSDNSLRTRFIPLDGGGSNTAMVMKVTGATASNIIAGVIAPTGKQFLSLNVALKNILEPQEVEVDAKGNNHPANWMSSVGSSGRKEFKIPQYLIPSLSSHLYLGWNNNGMYPVSKASWIAPGSLLVPGEMNLTVNPDEPLEGTLVFLVDEQPISQMSLHFYDTAYGHFNIDLVGVSDHQELQLDALPTTEPARLSDVFELKVTAVNDVAQIGPRAADELNTFRIVELGLISKVQALLDINPQEVFSLRIAADYGAFSIPIHAFTEHLPLGFSEARMVAPGSFNKVRFVFEIPRALAGNTSELVVDLREDDVVIPLTDSEVKLKKPSGEPVTAEGIKLYINQVGRVREIHSCPVDYIVADVTFVDELDGFGTEMVDGLKLVRDDYTGVRSEVDTTKLVTQGGLGDFTDSGKVFYELLPSTINASFVLGLDEAVKDGLTRRALVFFEIPEDGQDHQWTLQSGIFTNLNQAIPDQDYSHQELLGYHTGSDSGSEDGEFEQRLHAAITAAIREYQALMAARGKLEEQDRMDLSGIDDQEVTIAPPQTSISGVLALEKAASIDQLLTLLSQIKWLPSTDTLWQQRYAPAAVLTQMWGTEADMAGVAEEVLLRLGYNPERNMVDLTEAGLEALADMAHMPVDGLKLKHLPAIKYRENDEDRLLVFPFMADVSELAKYVSIPIRRIDLDPSSLAAEITVSFEVVAKSSGFDGQFADFASALGGAEDEEEILSHLLLQVKLPLADLSIDPIDLVYVSAGYDAGELYTAVLETTQGRFIGEDPIDTAEYDIKGATIEIAFQDYRYAYNLVLEKDQTIGEVAHTIAINSPDIPSGAAKELQQIADTLHQSTDRPDSLSVFQWYTRSIVNRFIVAQTEAERSLAEGIDLVIGRTSQPRVLVVTVENNAANNSVKTSIDLLGVANDIHSGDDQTQRAFNIAAGLMASSIEAKALGEGTGVFEIWSYLPDDATMLWIDDTNKSVALEVLEAAGFDQAVRRRIGETENKVIMIPLEQIILHGTPRTAWLEIDTNTYFTIGVLDSGEHGAMIESAVQNLLKQFTKYYVGALVGVQSMVWGVSSFALEYDDYKDILTAAVNHSLALAGQVKKALEELAKIDPRQVKSIMEKVESKSLSAINDLGQFGKDEASEYIKAKLEAIPTDKVKELLPDLSFVGGMVDGIELFATYARP